MAAKRYINGVTDIASGNPLRAFGQLDPRKYQIYHQDWSHTAFGAAAPAAGTAWSGVWNTSVGANTVVSVAAHADLVGTCLVIDNGGANDNEVCRLQAANGAFVMATGYKFWLESKFQLTAASMDDMEFAVGVFSETATATDFMADAGTALNADDGVGWYSFDGADDLIFTVGENTVYDTANAKLAMITTTWYRVTMYYDGTDIYHYVDNVLVGKLTPDQIPVTACTPTIFFKSGTGAQQYCRVNYLTVIAEVT